MPRAMLEERRIRMKKTRVWPALLAALVTLAGGGFCPGMLLAWFLGMCAMELFFFSFAVLCAMFTALVAVCSQIAVPMPCTSSQHSGKPPIPSNRLPSVAPSGR